MSSAGNDKWSEAAVKDLIFAMLMSNSDSKGNVTFNINWDNVAVFMAKWGYSFTKCAMNQHWSKRILKEFKDRHHAQETGNAVAGPSSAASTPRGNKAGGRASSAAGAPKTPASSKGKAKGSKGKRKRAAEDDSDNEANDTPPEGTNSTVDPIARNKTPRASATAKKVKYEEKPVLDDDGESFIDGYFSPDQEGDPAFDI